MEKYPFTPGGVEQWQNELYAKPDAEVAAEAAEVSASLTDWLPSRFSLTPEQVAYLRAVDSGLAAVWSTELAYAIIHRISVVLDKPTEPDPVSAKGVKLILSDAEWEWVESQIKQGKNSGKLTFTISY